MRTADAVNAEAIYVLCDDLMRCLIVGLRDMTMCDGVERR